MGVSAGRHGRVSLGGMSTPLPDDDARRPAEPAPGPDDATARPDEDVTPGPDQRPLLGGGRFGLFS